MVPIVFILVSIALTNVYAVNPPPPPPPPGPLDNIGLGQPPGPVVGPLNPDLPQPGGGPVGPGLPTSDPATSEPDLDVGHYKCNRTVVHTCKDLSQERDDTAACYCDEFCQIMDDCCDDYDRKYGKIYDRRREVLKKLECSSVNDKAGSTSLVHYPNGYLMMKSCPDSYPRSLVWFLCEQEDKRDMFRLWPVSSKRTGVFYKNIFCSMCWEDSDVLHWAVEWQCIKDEKEKEKVKEMEEKINRYINKKKGQGQCESRNDTVKNLMACRRLTGFLNPFNCTGKSNRNLRNCSLTYINTCNATWRNAAVKEECVTHTSRVMVTSDPAKIYRNHYCGICNYEKNKNLECVERKPGKGQARLEGLQVLFDAEIGCEENEILDVFAQKCRPLYCKTGQQFHTDRCSWLDTNRTSCDLVLINPEEYTHYQNGTLHLLTANMYVNESDFEIQNETVFVCSDVLATKKDNLISPPGMLTVIVLSISICSLFLLFMVYLVLPNLRNIPGKILMSLTFALFWAQILFLVGIERTEITELCIAFAMLIHYFFLATFTWMTMMAMDMALTFRPMNLHGTGGSKKNRFLYVSLYAWCFPVVLVVPGLIMDQYHLLTEPFNPGYAQREGVCWFSNKMALIIFFMVPCAAHLLVNFVCYVYTVYNIAAVSKLAKRAKQCDKCNLFLYFKLSLIMGGTWILAYVWIVTRSDVVQYAFIIFNGLQGLFLFIAFVCRKRTWRQLKRREVLTTTSRSTQDTSMSLRYRNPSYKFKYERPSISKYDSAALEGERKNFI